jgi:parallel beta-helix repeat protein
MEVWNTPDLEISGNLIAWNLKMGIFGQNSDGLDFTANQVLNNTEFGLQFSNVDNATISWNTFSGNGRSGICLETGSDHALVHNNTVTFNNLNPMEYHGGIRVYRSDWCDIDNNTITNNPYYGIFLRESGNHTVRGNEIVFNCGGRAGLGMNDVAFTQILYNNISNSTGHGIDAYMINSCIIHNNTINGNNMDELRDGAIRLYGSWKNEFNDNEILNNTGYGIHFSNTDNCTLARNTVSGHKWDGMFLELDSATNILVDNTVTWNNLNEDSYRAGIRLDDSGWGTITGNTISNNKIYGVSLDFCTYVTIEWNDIVWNCGGQAGLFFDDVHRTQVYWNNISNSTGTAIDIFYSTYNTFHNNTLNGNDMGMSGNSGGLYLSDSDWNTFVDNIILDNRIRGVMVQNSENNTFIRNDIGRNGGIGLQGSYAYNITLTNNSVFKNNGFGIYLFVTRTGSITHNELWNNSDYGVCINNCFDTEVYLNNFIGNLGSPQGYDNQNNTWDNGTHGNYWSDYNGADSGDDGIGDTPYALDGGAEDSLPIMNMTDTNAPRAIPEFPIVTVMAFVFVVSAAVFRRRRLN